MGKKEVCQHFWFVSVYSFYKEELDEITQVPAVGNPDITFQSLYKTVEASPESAEGMRATEIMCAQCGQRKDIEWPQPRTETAPPAVTVLLPIPRLGLSATVPTIVPILPKISDSQ